MVGLCAVLYPLIRTENTDIQLNDYNKEIYKAQLNEIKLDHAQGVLKDTEVKASHIEIARRLLAADRNAKNNAIPPPKKRYRILTVGISVIVIPSLSFLLYGMLGHPSLTVTSETSPALKEQARLEAKYLSPQAVILILSKKLQATRLTVQEWASLVRAHINIGKFKKAVIIAEEAVKMSKNDPRLLSVFGESLYFAANKTVTPAAKTIFLTVLRKDPTEPSAQYYLALDEAANEKNNKAYLRLQALIDQTPVRASYLLLLVEAADKIASKIKAEPILSLPAKNAVSKLIQKSPAWWGMKKDSRTIAAIMEADNFRVIKYMVNRIRQKLKKDSDDLKSWMQIATAYRILKEPNNELGALREASRLAPTNIEILLLYGRALRSISNNLETAESIALMRQVLVIDPENIEALFLLGRAEVAEGRLAIGKALMVKALNQIPYGTKEHSALKAQIKAFTE